MDNINEKSNADNDSSGANGPISSTKLKEYGKKAYGPLVDVVYKYQDEFTPYLNALAKGLQGGAKSLREDSTNEVNNYVAQLFQEASDGLKVANEKLESKDINAIGAFISEQSEKRPGVMFSTSYIAGLFFGRLARHLTKKNTTQPFSNEPSSPDEMIH
jgi:hypothetical protein